MSIFSAIRGKDSERIKELSRGLDSIGAEANAALNNINRDPEFIDHVLIDYPSTPHMMNGITQGIVVRTMKKDKHCQVLDVRFGKMAFFPNHKHPHYCVCVVHEGEVIDTVRGRRFDKGDWYLTKPHEEHSAQSIGGAVITVFNTYEKDVAESIITNRGYDLTKIAIDRLKSHPL